MVPENELARCCIPTSSRGRLQAFRTIFQLNCHRLVGAFHEESARIKLVQELQAVKAQRRSGAAQSIGIVRTGRASSWRTGKGYALKLRVRIAGGEVVVY